jgi:hypothetical protein
VPPPARIDRLLHLLIELDRDDIDVPARSEVSRRGIAIVQGEAEHDRQDQIREFPRDAVRARGELRHYAGRLRELAPGMRNWWRSWDRGTRWPAAPKS